MSQSSRMFYCNYLQWIQKSIIEHNATELLIKLIHAEMHVKVHGFTGALCMNA